MKLRVALLGKRNNRTPLAYSAYQDIVADSIDFVDTEGEADIVVYSCLKDIREQTKELADLRKYRELPKLVVISEEPFWDLIWEEEVFSSSVKLEHQEFSADVRIVNHFTSSLFHFNRFPYFITSEDKFFDRYSDFFSRNARLQASDWLSLWKQAGIEAAFYLEKRMGEKFDRAFPEEQVYGLCRYRSMLAKELDSPSVIRVGLGWGSKRRQSLPDWHLDKLNGLDNKARYISAIENTHQSNYITEKIFDAYACGGIPLYWACESHRIYEIVAAGSFMNLQRDSIGEACSRMKEGAIGESLAENYVETQGRLANLFSDKEALRAERELLANRIIRSLSE